LGVLSIREDIKKCIKVVDSSINEVPIEFILTLVAAEDHRSALHKGIDPIAMVRAAYVRLRSGDVQGASTIEQQFVRVVTNRFERTARRKIREQILAIAVSRRRNKFQIAAAYLSIAFYGSECTGVKGLRSCCGHNLVTAQENDILGMISRLKYPEPLYPSVQWKNKLHWRIAYIKNRERRSAVIASQSIFKPLIGLTVSSRDIVSGKIE
jgi:penicillin-binding protein 1A